MPLTDGFRFACGYTVRYLYDLSFIKVTWFQTTRAILGDAITLVRGDRFSTSDFTRTFFEKPTKLKAQNLSSCQPHDLGLPRLSKGYEQRRP